jgi:hypothetical protein
MLQDRVPAFDRFELANDWLRMLVTGITSALPNIADRDGRARKFSRKGIDLDPMQDFSPEFLFELSAWHCHVVERRPRKRCALRMIRRLRPLRTKCSSPQRGSSGGFVL